MSQYSDAVQADSPAAYWRLGDAVGPTVTAQIGNSLTAANAPTFGVAGLLTGDANTAMTFVAASSQTATGSDTGLPTGNGSWTVEAWLKTTTAAEQLLVGWGTAGATRDVIFGINAGALTLDTSSLFHSFGGAINDNIRHYVALTWNGTTMLAYVDGAQVGAGYTPGALNITLAGAAGARLAPSARFFDGTLDEVAIYPSTLSAARILAHWTAGSVAPPVAGFDFDAIATALALRFDPLNVTPPAGGYDNIRVSTPNAAEFLPPQPCVIVFVDNGTFETGNGDRQSVHDWLVRFYYSQGTDLAREQAALRKWATVLCGQLRASVTLSGTVTRATIDSYTLGVLTYAGEPYTGIELHVGIAIAEGWLAVA